ncbi:hypothetical protein LEP1GSC168_1216 [Leptospira santarosai str. HAI134]|nr:hypothetical protein LEP1GSC168_1216 [Leptospira santarosai str. HAI134]
MSQNLTLRSVESSVIEFLLGQLLSRKSNCYDNVLRSLKF